MGHLLPLMDIGAAAVTSGHEVVLASSASWHSKLEGGCASRGVSFRALNDGLTEEYIATFGPENCPFKEVGDKHTPLLKALALDLKPQVILADLPSVAGQRVSRALRIPLVINTPSPIALPAKFIPLMRNGLANLIARNLLSDVRPLIELFGREIGPALLKTYVMTNSAWGFEKKFDVAPNFIMTGPVSKRDAGERRISPANHPELCDWLEWAKAGGKPLVYVTTGSVLQPTSNMVTALFEGFRRCDCWVIWSLKTQAQDLLPKPMPDNFFVRAWQPENEILALPEVKIVLSHCGWGGLSCCMMSGKPVIAFPCFGDQPSNAKLLESIGCGVKLRPATATVDDVSKAASEILTNYGKYSAAAEAARQAFLATPGAPKVVEVLEGAAQPEAKFPVEGLPWHLSTNEETTKTCWPSCCG